MYKDSRLDSRSEIGPSRHVRPCHEPLTNSKLQSNRDSRYQLDAVPATHSNSSHPHVINQTTQPQPNFNPIQSIGSNLALQSSVNSNPETASEVVSKQQPNFKLSGALSKQARTNQDGIVLKFAVPQEARKPTLKWRLFPFKNDEALEPLPLHRKEVYLLGRDRSVVDIPLDHQSCSLQHAVIIFRQVTNTDITTLLKSIQVNPYIMDLGSTNGTYLNDARLDSSRYYQLLEKDCIKFGRSSREYVIINENTKKD